MRTEAESKHLREVENVMVLQDLPPYRPVARKLRLLTSRDDVPVSRVQEVLRTDAAFTADVLRLANSPLIGLRAEIASVTHAVMILGLERIKSLATTLCLRSFLVAGIPGDALHACWRHSLATAIICEKLARYLQIDADTCYTAGLLHDVGRLALLRKFPEESQRILDQPDSFDILQLEKTLFSVDHCEAGRWILEKWEFPTELCEVALLHHRLPKEGSSDLLRAVWAGWQAADLFGFSAQKRAVDAQLEWIAAVLPGRAGQKLLDQAGTLAEEVAFKINAVECSLV